MVVTIYENGTDDTDTCVYNKIDIINNSDIDFAYIHVSPSFNLQIKDEVSLLDINGDKIFGGYVRSINNQMLKETICFSYDILLYDIEIQKNFTSYSPEDIIKYCVELAGLTYNSTISSGMTLDLYPAKDKKLKDVINDMHNILGTVGRTDYDKNYYLEYPGNTFNSITLEVGQNCDLDDGWNLDTDNLCTQVKVKGALENVQTEQLFSGDGSTTSFELSKIFKTIKVEYPVGTELIPTISGVQTGVYSLSRETQKIVFDTAPASGTDNIKVTYTYDSEITYTESSEIINSTKSNLQQKTIKKDYLKTIEDVESYAGEYLSKFSQPLISGKIKYKTLNISNFSINESVQVVDNSRKVNGDFVNKTLLIKRMIREFGMDGASLIIEVGEDTNFVFNLDKEQEYRLKQLEENLTSAELLQFGIKTKDEITIQFDGDIDSIKKRTFASDTFYLEENSSGTRNQMKEDGTGPVMRETGYTSTTLTGDVSDRATESGDDRVTENSLERVTENYIDLSYDSYVTSTYQNYARDDLFTNLITNMSYIGVGDDNTTPTESDTTLNNETYRNSCTVTQSGLTLTSKIILDITQNNGKDIKEMGGFDNPSSGNLFYKDLTTVVAKDSDTVVRMSNIITVNTENTNI